MVQDMMQQEPVAGQELLLVQGIMVGSHSCSLLNPSLGDGMELRPVLSQVLIGLIQLSLQVDRYLPFLPKTDSSFMTLLRQMAIA